MIATTPLFRPVGVRELELIRSSGMRRFPPRLFWQPIFYPVLDEAYATQIARDWNTRDAASGFCGFVTRFAVRNDFIARFEVHRVGSANALELWVPACGLEDFNDAIVGTIEVIAEFRGLSAPR